MKTGNFAAGRLKETILRDRTDNSSEELKYVLSLITDLVHDFYDIDESSAKIHLDKMENDKTVITFSAEMK